MAIKLESVVDDLLQPLGRAAEKDDRSEGFEFGVVGLVGFGYNDCDSMVELLWPYCILNEAVEESPKAFEDMVSSLGVLLRVDKVFEVSPV